MTALLEVSEDDVLRRPAAELLRRRPARRPGRAAGGPGQGPHHRPALHRRAHLHDQHRHLPRRGRQRPRPHPHPVRHLPGAPPGHGEGAVHPHHGPRAQVPAGRGAQHHRGDHRQEPGRRPRRPTCRCCAAPRRASTTWCSSSATCCRSRKSEQAQAAERAPTPGSGARIVEAALAGQAEHLAARGITASRRARARAAAGAGPHRRPGDDPHQPGRQRRQVQPGRRHA